MPPHCTVPSGRMPPFSSPFPAATGQEIPTYECNRKIAWPSAYRVSYQSRTSSCYQMQLPNINFVKLFAILTPFY